MNINSDINININMNINSNINININININSNMNIKYFLFNININIDMNAQDFRLRTAGCNCRGYILTFGANLLTGPLGYYLIVSVAVCLKCPALPEVRVLSGRGVGQPRQGARWPLPLAQAISRPWSGDALAGASALLEALHRDRGLSAFSTPGGQNAAAGTAFFCRCWTGLGVGI